MYVQNRKGDKVVPFDGAQIVCEKFYGNVPGEGRISIKKYFIVAGGVTVAKFNTADSAKTALSKLLNGVPILTIKDDDDDVDTDDIAMVVDVD